LYDIYTPTHTTMTKKWRKAVQRSAPSSLSSPSPSPTSRTDSFLLPGGDSPAPPLLLVARRPLLLSLHRRPSLTVWSAGSAPPSLARAAVLRITASKGLPKEALVGPQAPLLGVPDLQEEPGAGSAEEESRGSRTGAGGGPRRDAAHREFSRRPPESKASSRTPSLSFAALSRGASGLWGAITCSLSGRSSTWERC
jgi:hypothetical protein